MSNNLFVKNYNFSYRWHKCARSTLIVLKIVVIGDIFVNDRLWSCTDLFDLVIWFTFYRAQKCLKILKFTFIKKMNKFFNCFFHWIKYNINKIVFSCRHCISYRWHIDTYQFFIGDIKLLSLTYFLLSVTWSQKCKNFFIFYKEFLLIGDIFLRGQNK